MQRNTKQNNAEKRSRRQRMTAWLSAHPALRRYLVLALFGVLLVVQLATEKIDLQIEEVFWSEELIANKPPLRYLVNQVTAITDDSGKLIGELQVGTRVFSAQTPTTAPMHGVIYGWVWHESVLPQGDILTLTRDENVRGRADGTIFGRLSSGTILREHYLNDNQAWYLFSRSVNVPGSALSPLPSDFKEPTWLGFKPTFLSVTTKQGGYRIKSWFTVGQMILFAPFGFLFLALFVARRKREEKSTYLFEFWKSILQIFSGFLVAALVFWFGFKR